MSPGEKITPVENHCTKVKRAILLESRLLPGATASKNGVHSLKNLGQPWRSSSLRVPVGWIRYFSIDFCTAQPFPLPKLASFPSLIGADLRGLPNYFTHTSSELGLELQSSSTSLEAAFIKMNCAICLGCTTFLMTISALPSSPLGVDSITAFNNYSVVAIYKLLGLGFIEGQDLGPGIAV